MSYLKYLKSNLNIFNLNNASWLNLYNSYFQELSIDLFIKSIHSSSLSVFLLYLFPSLLFCLFKPLSLSVSQSTFQSPSPILFLILSISLSSYLFSLSFCFSFCPPLSLCFYLYTFISLSI